MKSVIVFSAFAAATFGCANALSAPDPANDKAVVPPVRYQSPFRDYRPLGEDQPIPWKAANDEVARIGGWRAYAKEARELPSVETPAAVRPPAATPPAAPAPKRPPGHDGHGKPD